VERFGIPWHHIPVTPDTKEAAEQQALELLDGKVDVIVLARYMQIVSPKYVAEHPNRIINIQHSFLPAFIGAKPYQQTWDCGVKQIGATSNYVEDELDQVPMIEEHVYRVTHRHSAAVVLALGQDEERSVLLRAVR